MTQDQNIPIDILTSKLVEWLISRRHVKKDWSDAVQEVRKKINNSIQDMPEHPEIIKLLSGSYINYFHCLKIVEILKETEKDSKNIFGWYTSQRMKDWQEIISLYERNNVNLAEASQFFMRNVTYEIPSLKRSIAKAKQIRENSDKREKEYRKNAILAKEKYFSLCKQMGLQGHDIRTELLELLNQLPKEFEKIATQVKPLKEVVILYKEFGDFTCPTIKSSPAPLLSFIIDRGNTTVYEWKYGEAPIEIKVTGLDYSTQESTEKDEDNGFVVLETPDEGGIDFGDDDLSTGDIDWGTLDSLSVDDGPTIDWDITEADKSDCADIVVESSGLQGGVAEGDEALTILYNEATRNTFVNELLELKGFLMQRKVELGNEETVLSMSLFANAPKVLQYQSVKTFDSHLEKVNSIINQLSSAKMQHLYLISLSPKYVDRFADSLRAKLRESDKLNHSIEVLQSKQKQAVLDECQMSAQLKQLSARTKELQGKIEKEISAKYNNRRVNLMGCS